MLFKCRDEGSRFKHLLANFTHNSLQVLNHIDPRCFQFGHRLTQWRCNPIRSDKHITAFRKVELKLQLTLYLNVALNLLFIFLRNHLCQENSTAFT